MCDCVNCDARKESERREERNGVYIKSGCFWGTRAEFAAKVAATHGDNEHGQEYAAALVLIDAHAKLWTPVGDEDAKGV